MQYRTPKKYEMIIWDKLVFIYLSVFKNVLMFS